MVVLFVILTIIFFVTLDLFIQKKQKIVTTLKQKPVHFSLSQLFNLLPPGVFTQPTFTWCKILDSGNLMLGINPVLLGIIGAPDEIKLLDKGEAINKGDSLLKIYKGDKVISIHSPLKGNITSLNSEMINEPTWENLSTKWIYCIKPENMAEEVQNWHIAGRARVWLKDKFIKIKNFLIDEFPQTELGTTMADGGDIPLGILAQFDKNTWERFEQKFLHQQS